MAIEIRAAQRLKAKIFVSPERKKELIRQMMDKCKCDESTARHYLDSEEWIIVDAEDSYKADKKAGLHANKIKAAKRYLGKGECNIVAQAVESALNDIGGTLDRESIEAALDYIHGNPAFKKADEILRKVGAGYAVVPELLEYMI